MNYTQNHHLPQWVKSDRIMMDDFNAAMASIESGMSGNAQAAASAQATANTANSTANTALSTANTAKSAAANAQSTANTARQEAAVLPYAVGKYTGTGANKTISVGFRPSFLIINGHKEDSVSQLRAYGMYACATTGSGTVDSAVQFTSTGFTVIYNSSIMPALSSSGRTYEYIAFR